MDVFKILQPPREGDLISYEVDQNFTRERVVFAANNAGPLFLDYFSVVGVQAWGAQTLVETAKAGNAGDGAMAGLAANAGVAPGKWVVKFDAAGAGAAFTVYNPAGVEDGEGAAGAAYAGSIQFTVADDAGHHFAVNDELYVTVSYAAGTGLFVPVNPAAVDGSQHAVGVLFGTINKLQGEQANGSILARGPSLLRSARLAWPAGSTQLQQAAWLNELAVGVPAIAQATGLFGMGGILARASG